MTRVRTRFSVFIGGRNLGDRQALAAATNPICTAIDVRPPRYVTSPIAQIPGTVVAQVSSTTTWPAGVVADQHHAGTAPGGLSGRFDWPAGF